VGGNLADDGSRYKFVLAQPRLNHDQLESGAAAIHAIRDAASRLESAQRQSKEARGRAVDTRHSFATSAGRKPLSPGHLCLPRGQTEPLSSLRRPLVLEREEQVAVTQLTAVAIDCSTDQSNNLPLTMAQRAPMIFAPRRVHLGRPDGIRRVVHGLDAVSVGIEHECGVVRWSALPNFTRPRSDNG
jgi:hypothetical protein